MLSIPSSRKLASSATIIFTILVSIWIVIQLRETILESIAGDHIIVPERHDLRPAIDFDMFTTLEEYFVQQYHASNKPVEPSKHLISQLSQCQRSPNSNTNHIRLSFVKVVNISMVPSDDFAPEIASYRYFNPAIMPLPSHVYTTSGYRYLLVSRLVTTGHHQESHICFADICSPQSSLSHNTRPCSVSDLDWLGPQGGLRCITKPARVNIPPTPSRLCTGAWSTFPDIPGFHDPRLFWSGRGEPLIEVNSGSQYGCVGLWLQDLRAVYPLLDEVLNKREKGLRTRDPADEVGGSDREQAVLDLLALGPPIAYHSLTEITKNPRESRSEVEKNWVLFFPTEDETWVQYDMMGKTGFGEERHREKSPQSSITADKFVESQSLSAEAVRMTTTTTEPATEIREGYTVEATSATAPIGVEPILDSEDNVSSTSSTSAIPEIDLPDITVEPELKEISIEDGLPKREVQGNTSDVVPIDTVESPQSTYLSHTSYSTISSTQNESTISTSAAQTAASDEQSSIHDLKMKTHNPGGRSLAQLLSYGHTTPNLTSPLEQPCFNLMSHTHLHDRFNNTGHWHQGSNSLRLIFCTFEQFRARSCIPNEDPEVRNGQDMSWEQYERLLVKEGLVVHFSIVHRKFNNDWDLPMRYERYFLVWEARKPFRILGVSRYPILFGGERARPWTEDEDLGVDSKPDFDEQEKRDGLVGEMDEVLDDKHMEIDQTGTYFTYTPSLAWAWRPNSDDGATQERGHEDLGTGYLGEDIVIGIGMDDVAQGFVKVKVDKLLACLRLCPF